MESLAIGAQWEWVQRIPPTLRNKIEGLLRTEMSQELQKALDSSDVISILKVLSEDKNAVAGAFTYLTLHEANLSKEQFVTRFQELHRYRMKDLYIQYGSGAAVFTIGYIVNGLAIYQSFFR